MKPLHLAVLLIGANVVVGLIYGIDCRRNGGGTLRECYEMAADFSGLGSKGPLALAVGIGSYAMGDRNGYTKGYNTYNPYIRKPKEKEDA